MIHTQQPQLHGGEDDNVISPSCVITGAPRAVAAMASIPSIVKQQQQQQQDVAIVGHNSSLSSSSAILPLGGGVGGGEYEKRLSDGTASTVHTATTVATATTLSSSLSSSRYQGRIHALEKALQGGDQNIIQRLTMSPLDELIIPKCVTTVPAAVSAGQAPTTRPTVVAPVPSFAAAATSTSTAAATATATDEDDMDVSSHGMSSSDDHEPINEEGQSLATAGAQHQHQRRAVHFAPRLQKRKSKWYREELDGNVWYNPEQIHRMGLKARSDAKRLSKDNPKYTDAVLAVFQDTCGVQWTKHQQQQQMLQDPHKAPGHREGSISSSRNLRGSFSTTSTSSMLSLGSSSASRECNIYWDLESVQNLLLSDQHPRSLRGLENRIMPVLKNYRSFHSQSVLAIQEKRRRARGGVPKASRAVSSSDGDSTEGQLKRNASEMNDDEVEQEITAQIIRARSLRTSRPSRALARIFAQTDANEVATMIRDELMARRPAP